MNRVKALALCVAGAVLLAGLASAQGQPLALDRELEQAKVLYRQGKFHEAIFTLQEVVTGLKPLRDVEVRKLQLADAYLHLALSYLAINEPAVAKETLRGMLKADPERRLDPEVYAPKVIALLEEVRAELPGPTPATAAEPRPSPQASQGQVKRNGSRLPLILIAAGGAAGAGVAVAAGGGSKASPSPAAAPTPPPRRTDTLTWVLPAGSERSVFVGAVRVANGPVDVTLNFSGNFIILACVGTSSACRPMGGRPGSATYNIPTDFPAGLIQATVYFNSNFPQPPGDASGTFTFTYNPQ